MAIGSNLLWGFTSNSGQGCLWGCVKIDRTVYMKHYKLNERELFINHGKINLINNVNSRR